MHILHESVDAVVAPTERVNGDTFLEKLSGIVIVILS